MGCQARDNTRRRKRDMITGQGGPAEGEGRGRRGRRAPQPAGLMVRSPPLNPTRPPRGPSASALPRAGRDPPGPWRPERSRPAHDAAAANDHHRQAYTLLSLPTTVAGRAELSTNGRQLAMAGQGIAPPAALPHTSDKPTHTTKHASSISSFSSSTRHPRPESPRPGEPKTRDPRAETRESVARHPNLYWKRRREHTSQSPLYKEPPADAATDDNDYFMFPSCKGSGGRAELLPRAGGILTQPLVSRGSVARVAVRVDTTPCTLFVSTRTPRHAARSDALPPLRAACASGTLGLISHELWS
ncbi:hypothetical protein KGM_210721 [Danaus plexippus plexippus]|uniref:Uncharacterized protein n=1 Tax=Danaus plexippus plexippus TaxID=278856 RepID=A0A212F199_DANPL|nr:hypothetical protein KGM_210721 [Danaus plexippus plexippus]